MCKDNIHILIILSVIIHQDRCKIVDISYMDHIKAIIRNTRRILRKAIRAGGTTIRSYTSSLGVTGLFQMSLRAHDQKKCPVCKGEIRKIKVGGRGTYYCPNCQKESE